MLLSFFISFSNHTAITCMCQKQSCQGFTNVKYTTFLYYEGFTTQFIFPVTLVFSCSHLKCRKSNSKSVSLHHLSYFTYLKFLPTAVHSIIIVSRKTLKLFFLNEKNCLIKIKYRISISEKHNYIQCLCV